MDGIGSGEIGLYEIFYVDDWCIVIYFDYVGFLDLQQLCGFGIDVGRNVGDDDGFVLQCYVGFFE